MRSSSAFSEDEETEYCSTVPVYAHEARTEIESAAAANRDNAFFITASVLCDVYNIT